VPGSSDDPLDETATLTDVESGVPDRGVPGRDAPAHAPAGVEPEGPRGPRRTASARARRSAKAGAGGFSAPGYASPGLAPRGDPVTSFPPTRPRDEESRTVAGPTPLATLHVEEVARTRAFLRVALLLGMTIVVAAPFLGGDPLAQRVIYVAMAVMLAGCGWLAWLIRDDAAYTPRRATLVSWVCVSGALSGLYFFGAFSPAAVVVPFGLYFFSLTRNLRAAVVAYVGCAVGYAVLVGGELLGLLADRGVVHSSVLPPLDRVVMAGIVEAIFLATFVIARASRAANLAAVERHDRVLRSLGQREALLQEAREDLDHALRVGGVGRFTDTVLGGWRLGAVLGRGAMGEVYEAVHPEHGEGAVKVLQMHLYRDAASVRRFLREARLASALHVPNVVEVFEVGGLDAGIPFIAMERLTGEDLADVLRRRRRLSPRRTVRLVREVAAGLEAARAAGIVHRDLKPRNVFSADVGRGRRVWKVLDFGVSKLASATDTLTADRAVGTPSYMAPEQAKGERVSHRTDVHALGVLCYRALTGRPAFAGTDVPDTLYAVVYTMPVAPSVVVPALPAEVDLVLAVALAKDPDERFGSALELAAAFGAAVRGEIDGVLEGRARRVLQRMPWKEAAAPQSAAD
jgi:eukaryotic-like serine/threonine-protein kinase